MNTTDLVKLAEFLARDYPFDIRVTNGACPVCFKFGKVQSIKSTRDSNLDSPTSKFESRRKRFELWMELFNEGGLDPIQCINAYVPSCKKAKQVPKFSYPLIIQTTIGEPCKNKLDCVPTCLICNTPMEHLPSVTAAPWTIPVHEVCCDPCGYTLPGAARGICCQTPALTIPKLFKDTLGIDIRCIKHGSGSSLPINKKTEVGPLSRDSRAETTAPQPTTKTALPSMPKPKPVPRKPVKADRFNEKGCHDIAKLLWPDRHTPVAKSETKRAKPDIPKPEADPTLSHGLGAAFLYGAKKFDFTEPKRLFPSDDLAHQKDKDEAGPCTGDGEDGSAP